MKVGGSGSMRAMDGKVVLPLTLTRTRTRTRTLTGTLTLNLTLTLTLTLIGGIMSASPSGRKSI